MRPVYMIPQTGLLCCVLISNVQGVRHHLHARMLLYRTVNIRIFKLTFYHRITSIFLMMQGFYIFIIFSKPCMQNYIHHYNVQHPPSYRTNRKHGKFKYSTLYVQPQGLRCKWCIWAWMSTLVQTSFIQTCSGQRLLGRKQYRSIAPLAFNTSLKRPWWQISFLNWGITESHTILHIFTVSQVSKRVELYAITQLFPSFCHHGDVTGASWIYKLSQADNREENICICALHPFP